MAKQLKKRKKTYPFRVFISYAGKDKKWVEHLVRILKKNNLIPVWDEDIWAGKRFDDAVQKLIDRAHIFMPLITKTAKGRGWVHQEIGYALGVNLPVLPVAVDTQPGEMIAPYKAITITKDELEKEDSKILEQVQFEHIVLNTPFDRETLIEVAEWPYERAKWLGEKTNWVFEKGGYVTWRQSGALSSLSVPDADLNKSVWKKRRGKHRRGDDYHYRQREERRALEKHAEKKGCRLIISPEMKYDNLEPRAIKTRLKTLRDALKSLKKTGLIEVYMSPKVAGSNLTIVGDWFTAESRLPRVGGYRYTVFNWHAPTVYHTIKQFDKIFEELKAEAEHKSNHKMTPEASCDAAIAVADKRIARLKKKIREKKKEEKKKKKKEEKKRWEKWMQRKKKKKS